MTVSDHKSDHPGLELLGAGEAYRDEIATHLESTGYLFREFEWSQIQTLAGYMALYRAASGATIFREGDRGAYMCVVAAGKLEMYKEDRNGEAKLVATMGRGKTIGEMAMLDGEPRSATAVVKEEVLLLILTQKMFAQILLETPALAAKMLLLIARMLSQRLRLTSGELVDYLDAANNGE